VGGSLKAKVQGTGRSRKNIPRRGDSVFCYFLQAARGWTSRAAFSIITSAAHFVNRQFEQKYTKKYPKICATFFSKKLHKKIP